MTFFQSLAFDKDLGATRGIDAALKQNNVDALVLPAAGRTTVPAGNCRLFIFQSHGVSCHPSSILAAIAGYPIVTGEFFFDIIYMGYS